MANDRKPGPLGNQRFPEGDGESKHQGDPMIKAPGHGADANANEGEGNKSADRRYREGVEKTVHSGQVEKRAKEAEQALEGDEGKELRRAEEAGKKHSHGEDPALNKRKH